MRLDVVFVLLFAVATAVALLARRLKVPYTVALVLAGLVLGAVHALEPPHLTKELLYTVFLPGLVFEAAFHIDFQRFWENKVAVHALAIPGVIGSMLLTAAILVPTIGRVAEGGPFGFRHALVFGAVIAATDPIAVIAIFKRLGAPKRLSILIEGESLLNDGTAAVFFTLAVGLATGRPVSWTGDALEFLRITGFGLAVGALVGYSTSRIIQSVDDPMIEITLTTIAAWGSFVAAENLHASGVMSTVAAGLVCGNFAARTGMSPTTRVAVETFWEYVAFALNSIVFLLIGFEARLGALVASWKPILIAYVAATFARAAMTHLVTAVLWPTAERIPWRWTAVLTWAGLRGGLAMVLALGLPKDFPGRELVVTMTFGVAVLSILLQGMSMTRVLRLLGLGTPPAHVEHEVQVATVRAAKAALSALLRMEADGGVQADAANALREEYAKTIEAAQAKVRELHVTVSELREHEHRAARHHLLSIEKEVVLDARRRGLLADEAAEILIARLDARIVANDEAGPS